MHKTAARSLPAIAVVASVCLSAAPANAQSHVPPTASKGAPKIAGFTWEHQALGNVTTIASPRPNELFALEAHSNSRAIEHYINNRWTHINVPADAEAVTDSNTSPLPQAGLSSADPDQFWMRNSVDDNSLYHWSKNAWTRIPGPTVTTDGPTPKLAWVADIPGDGAILGYTAYKDWEDSTTYLYRVSDKGSAKRLGSVKWTGRALVENGTVLIANRDPGGGTLVVTVDPGDNVLSIMEQRLYALAAQNSTNAWVSYVSGTCTDHRDTPNATCASGVTQVTSEGTGISMGTSELTLSNSSGAAREITTTGLTSLQAVSEPGSDDAWITGKTTSGTTQFYHGTKLASHLA